MDPLRVNQHTLCFISIFIKIYINASIMFLRVLIDFQSIIQNVFILNLQVYNISEWIYMIITVFDTQRTKRQF